MKALFAALALAALAAAAFGVASSFTQTSGVRENAAAALKACGKGRVATVSSDGYTCISSEH